MKKLTIVVLFAVSLVGVTLAQNTLPVQKVDGVKSLGAQRYGDVIWDNFSATGWFSSMTPGYMWLDWGKLLDAGNMMPDEVIDGIGFSYATDATVGGISWDMYYFDSCTGWADYSIVQEAGFAFTGLPDATNLPPGYYWGWIIHVDLEGTGYEFLMGYDIGIGHSLQTAGITCGPRLTKPPLTGGNSNTLTEDAFNIVDSLGNTLGTYWFGGYPANPYSSFCARLMGGSDPSANCTYGAIPLQGNNTGLYCVGDWELGGYNLFLIRMNQMSAAGGLFFNYTQGYRWHNSIGKSTVPTVPVPAFAKIIFQTSYVGDYLIFPYYCKSGAVSIKWYIQGAISNRFFNVPPYNLYPLDASMDVIETP